MKEIIKKILSLFPKKFSNKLLGLYDDYFCTFILPFIRYGFREGRIIIQNIKKEGLVKIKLSKYGEIYLRDNLADRKNFIHIFIKKEYEINLDINPEVIIDAGAYIGLSTIFFANLYSNAKIISIEPEKSNFEILKLNTEQLKNVTILNNAIWNKDGILNVVDVGLDKWGFIVDERENRFNNSQVIEGITINYLIKTFSLNKIDLLKIDIEGSEKELFSFGYEEWIPHVNCIIIEFHDRIKPGCYETVNTLLTKYGFIRINKGQNNLYIKKRF